MQVSARSDHGAAFAVASVSALALIALGAILSRMWVLTAIPVGFLFGFFLQKGDLCGASAFSEVLMMRDRRKVFGLWVAIVASMVGFAVLDLLGLVRLNPKPMLWLSCLVGGVVFGVGTVLAGGCVSGCLFKTGTGNLSSMAALVGIPLGVAMVEYGPLNPLHRWMKQFVLRASDGGSVTLSSVTGIPFWAIAVVCAMVTLAAALAFRHRGESGGQRTRAGRRAWLTSSWRPWQAGLAIGILGVPAYLSSAASGRNYPLGVTHGVLHAQNLVTDGNLRYVWRAKPATAGTTAAVTGRGSTGGAVAPAPQAKGKKVVWWLVALVTSLVVGSWVSGRLSGQARLLPKPPAQTVFAFGGGLLVGTGAALAGGCVIGNILSGWALMSVGAMLFGVVTILANWAATYFYLMGGPFQGPAGGTSSGAADSV